MLISADISIVLLAVAILGTFGRPTKLALNPGTRAGKSGGGKSGKSKPKVNETDPEKTDPCLMKFPCFNLGKCVTDPRGLDYLCECYKDYYKEPSPRKHRHKCTYVVDKCKEGACRGSTCLMGWAGSSWCYDSKDKMDPVYGVYDPDAIAGHPYFIFIFVSPGEDRETVRVVNQSFFGFDTGEGIRMQISFIDVLNKTGKQLPATNDVSTNLMYFKSKAARTFIHRKRISRGYPASLVMLLFYTYHSKDVDLTVNFYAHQNIGKERVNITSQVHVYDDPEECTPFVEIIGCSAQAAGYYKSGAQPLLWDYREGHTFRPYIEQKCQKENSTLKVVWINHDIVYNITTGFHEDFAVKGTHSKSRMDPFDTWRSITANFVPPHSGRSVVELLVYETVDAGLIKSKISFYNSVQCQINVYPRLPLTVVWGGVSRTHARGDPLTVDIRNSFLPWMENPYYWPNHTELKHWLYWKICLQVPLRHVQYNDNRDGDALERIFNQGCRWRVFNIHKLYNNNWHSGYYYQRPTYYNWQYWQWMYEDVYIPGYSVKVLAKEWYELLFYKVESTCKKGAALPGCLNKYGEPRGVVSPTILSSKEMNTVDTIEIGIRMYYSNRYTEEFHKAPLYITAIKNRAVKVKLIQGRGLPLLNVRCLRNCGMGGPWFDDGKDKYNTTEYTMEQGIITRVLANYGVGDDLMIDTTLTSALLVECIERCTPEYEKTETFKWEIFNLINGFNSTLKLVNINWKTNHSPQNSRVLILNAKTLQRNKTYHFRATSNVPAQKESYAEFQSEINGGFKKIGTCSVKPLTGMAGFTDFEISCKGFEKEYLISNLNYKFYQTQTDENGTKEEVLLEWTFHSAVRHIKLAKGKDRRNQVKVVILDTFGLNATINMVVALTPMTEDEMYNMTFNHTNPQSLPNRATASDVAGVVRLSSALIDALTLTDLASDEKDEYIAYIMSALAEADAPCIDSVTQLNGVMKKLSKIVKDSLTIQDGIKVMRLYSKIVKQLNQYSKYYWAKKETVTDEIIATLKVLVPFLSITIEMQTTEEKEETSLFFDVYEDLMVMKDISQQKIFSDYAYEAVSTVGISQLNRLVETEDVQVRGGDDYYLHCWVNYSQFFPKMFGDKLANISVSKLDDFGLIGFKFLRIPNDVFWWRTAAQRMEINSHLVFTYMEKKDYKKSYGIEIPGEKIKHPITYKFGINKSDIQIKEVKGTFDEYSTDTEFNKKIKIYRFDMKQGQYLAVNFTSMETESLKVVFTLNKVPTENDFQKAIIIKSGYKPKNKTKKKPKGPEKGKKPDKEEEPEEEEVEENEITNPFANIPFPFPFFQPGMGSAGAAKRQISVKQRDTPLSQGKLDYYISSSETDGVEGGGEDGIRDDSSYDASKDINVYDYISSHDKDEEDDEVDTDIDSEDDIDTPTDALMGYETGAFYDTNEIDDFSFLFDENASSVRDIYDEEQNEMDVNDVREEENTYEEMSTSTGSPTDGAHTEEDAGDEEEDANVEGRADRVSNATDKDEKQDVVADDNMIESRAEKNKESKEKDTNIINYTQTPRVKKDSFIYMGILPTAAELNEEADFTFQALSSSCLEWVKGRWKINGCKFDIKNKPWDITCTCKRMGLTAAGSYTAHGSWYIPDILFVATGPEPPQAYYVDCFIVIIVVLALFLFLFVWAIFKDCQDKEKRKVIVLEDNSTEHKNGYLLTVYTGAHRDAGTSSLIGIQLFGSAHNSERHLLKSERSEILEDGSTDWFMIFTQEPLGDILKIHVWSNCRGHRQAWYCSHIVVRDLQGRKAWTFMVERWISLAKGDGLVAFRLRPAPLKEIFDKRSQLLRNLVHFGSEGHMWFSILTNHPRSFYSRKERVLVCACGTLLNIFLTIFLYRFIITSTHPIVYGIVKLSPDHLLLALICSMCSVPLTFIISFLFRKSPSFSVRLLKSPTPKVGKTNRRSYIYYDVEKAGRVKGFNRVIFYVLPTYPLCESKRAFEKRIKRLKRPTETCKNHVFSCKKKGAFKEKKLHYHTDHFFLPVFFRLVAWVLCLGGIVAFAVLSVLFQQKIREVNTLEWFDTFLLMISFNILLVEPIKILLTGVFATYVVKVEPMEYDMQRGYPLLPQVGILRREKDLRLIRALQDYSPITTWYIPELRAREKARLSYGIRIVEILCFLLFAFVVFAAVYYVMHERNMAIHHTNNVRQLFVHGVNKSMGVKNIKIYTDIYDYIEDTFIPLFDEAENEADPNEMLKEHQNMMVGMPRLRQLRVKNESDCPGLTAQEFLNCIPAYNSETSDESKYYMGWDERSPDVDRYSLRAREQFWTYHNNSETKSISIKGEQNIYSGGGYIANLGRYIKNMNITLQYLKRNEWLTSFTSLVVLEVCLYNVNNGFLTIVNIIFERDVSGFFFPSDTITSVNLNKYPVSSTLIMEVTFAVAVSALVFYQIIALQIYSFKKYFRDWWNIYDILLSFVALTTVSLFLIRRTKMLKMFYLIDQLDENQYLAIREGHFVNDTFLKYVAVLLLFTTIRLAKVILQFFCFRRLEITLYVEIMYIIFWIILTFIVLLGCAITACLAFSYKNKHFRTPLTGLATVTAQLFSSAEEKLSLHESWFVQMFYCVVVLISVIVLNEFRAILLQAYTVAKIMTWRTFSYGYCDYCCEEYRYHCKFRRKAYKMKTRRLRGGADEDGPGNDASRPIVNEWRDLGSRKKKCYSLGHARKIKLGMRSRIPFSNTYIDPNKNPSFQYDTKNGTENLKRIVQMKTRNEQMEKVGSVLSQLRREVKGKSQLLKCAEMRAEKT